MTKSYTFAVAGAQSGHIDGCVGDLLADGHRCKGIFEDDRRAAQTFAEKWKVPSLASLDEAFAPEVDFIVSAARNDLKIDLIERCEAAGIGIMLDKPAVTGREGLERLRAVVERSGIAIGLLLSERYRAVIREAKRRIVDGELGELVSLSLRKPHRLSPEARQDWFYAKDQNGGILLDLFIHDFDLLRFLTGQELVSLHSRKAKRIMPERAEFYDTASVQAVLEEGIIAQLYTDWHAPRTCWSYGDCRIFIIGTNGSMELRLTGDPLLEEAGNELLLLATSERGLHRAEIRAERMSMARDFVNRLEGGPSLLTNMDIYLASRASVEADEQAVVYNRFQTDDTE
ncbi:Gfo/Idh/MocA family protein [Paenibacillus hodogayensis]|uniref:Gfo/Idh/MocA family protein n=1 Tax=Paenibacillus hodogayensis TaxID=279208 RepID=A0ABV5W5H6_9BACL